MSFVNSFGHISFAQIRHLLARTYSEWDKDECPRLGAALAFYTMLSLAPTLVLLLAIAGLVFGADAARGQLFGQIEDLVGPQGAATIQEMVKNASKPGTGIFASIVGIVTLILGASSVAMELRNALNRIWKRRNADDTTIVDMVKEKSGALAVVLGAGFLLVTSLAVSSLIAAAGKWFADILPIPEFILSAMNFIVGVLVIAGVFTVLFRYLPDVRIQWNDVLLGAVFTSVMFSIGKYLIGLYLGKASVGSSYGAAGSLVIVLVWVYYSAQIFFFGAEFTQVYASEHGSDPMRRKKRRPVQEKPQPAEHEHELASAAAYQHPAPSGIFGTLIGSALAVTKVLRGVRR